MTARNGARMAGYDWAYVQGGRNVADSRTAGALCRFMSALVAAEGGENLRIGIVRARRNEATIESCDGSLASALAGAMSSAMHSGVEMHSGIEMSVPSSTSWLYVLAQEYRDKEIEVSGIVEYATLRGTIAEAACVDGSHLYVQVCAKRDGPAPLGPLHFLAEPTKAPWAVLAPVRSDADGCEEAEPRPAWVRSLESILRSISRSLVSERRIDDDEAERRDWVPIEKTQKHGRYVWRARCVQLPMTITGKANVLCLPRARCSHSARPRAVLFSLSSCVWCLTSRTSLRLRGAPRRPPAHAHPRPQAHAHSRPPRSAAADWPTRARRRRSGHWPGPRPNSTPPRRAPACRPSSHRERSSSRTIAPASSYARA